VQGFTVTGLAFTIYPFIRSFLPTSNSELSMEIDISGLMPGDSKTVSWQGRHLYVVRRSLNSDNSSFKADDLKDPQSSSSRQPGFAKNPWRSRKPDLFIVYKNCTHLGCEVRLEVNEEGLGFECPCHRSEFDQSGRVRKESIASFNLEVPDYQYLSRKIIKLVKG